MATIKTNELPYQTYERITGKKWGSDPSAYKTYGVSAPAGSSAANLQLQSKLLTLASTDRPILTPTPLAPAPTPTTNPQGLNAQQMTDYANGKIDVTGKPITALAVTPTPATTNPISSVPESAVDKATRAYYEALPRTTPTDTDKAAIRESIRQQMQNQIDAVNNVYDGLVANAKTEGENRVGQTRAIASRSGLLGAPMGDAQKANTDAYNTKVVNAIDAERGAKIAAIWDTIDQRSMDQFDKQKTEALTNAKSYIDYLKTSQDSARTDMSNLAKSGVDISSLSEDDYKKLLDQTGYNPIVFKSLWNSSLPSNQKRDYNYVNLGSGKVAVFSVNPATNKMEKEEYSVDLQPNQEIKEFDGMPYIVNKDEKGNLSLQNLSNFNYGATNKNDTVSLRGGLYNIKTNKWVVAPKETAAASDKMTTDELAMIANQKVAPQLDGVKGSDGYVSASDYRKARNAYVASGLSAKNFDDNFSVYVNPNMVDQYDLVGKKLSTSAN